MRQVRHSCCRGLQVADLTAQERLHCLAAAYTRAVTNGPDFTEAEAEYPTLLRETGWAILEHHDLTPDFAASHRRQLRADAAQKDALTTLLGAGPFVERQVNLNARLACLEEGLLRRELFVATA